MSTLYDWALAVAEEEGASLNLLHTGLWLGEVPVEDSEAVLAGSKRNLEQLLASRVDLGLKIEIVAEFGSPAESILDHAAAKRSGLIVMGLRAAAPLRFSSHIFWTACHKVIAQAQCPVLTVHG